MCFCVDLQRHVRKKCMPVGVRVREGNSNPLQYSCLGNAERLHFHFSLSRIGEGQGNPLQCSCLENPRDRGAWWAAVYGDVKYVPLFQLLHVSPLLFLCTDIGLAFSSVFWGWWHNRLLTIGLFNFGPCGCFILPFHLLLLTQSTKIMKLFVCFLIMLHGLQDLSFLTRDWT